MARALAGHSGKAPGPLVQRAQCTSWHPGPGTGTVTASAVRWPLTVPAGAAHFRARYGAALTHRSTVKREMPASLRRRSCQASAVSLLGLNNPACCYCIWGHWHLRDGSVLLTSESATAQSLSDGRDSDMRLASPCLLKSLSAQYDLQEPAFSTRRPWMNRGL